MEENTCLICEEDLNGINGDIEFSAWRESSEGLQDNSKS